MTKEKVQTEFAPKAIGPYSQAVKIGNVVYLSGQIPLDPNTMELVSSEIKEQARQVFKNLNAVCNAASGDLSSIVRITIYLLNLNDFATVNEVMTEFFPVPLVARTTIGVAALPKQSKIEIDAIAVL